MASNHSDFEHFETLVTLTKKKRLSASKSFNYGRPQLWQAPKSGSTWSLILNSSGKWGGRLATAGVWDESLYRHHPKNGLFSATKTDRQGLGQVWSVNGRFDEFYMILMLVILRKVHQDKVWEFHKHYNHLKFVKLSIYHARIFDGMFWFFAVSVCTAEVTFETGNWPLSVSGFF